MSAGKQVQPDHEYLRIHVDPVLMPLIEMLLLYQPQCLYEFIYDYTSENIRSELAKPVHHARRLRNRRRCGNRTKMVDYMASSVIPVMDQLAHQIMKQKPLAVLEFIQKLAFACLQHEGRSGYHVGERVLCRYKGRPRFRAGQVTLVSEDGETFDILYDDGRREHNVHRVCLKRDVTIEPKDEPESQTVSHQNTQYVVHPVDIVIVIIGLDGSGKTTLLSTLQGDIEKEHVPSVGFTSAKFEIAEGHVTLYDLGGGPSFRDVWREYYADVHGVIFVVDSSQISHVSEAAPLLHKAIDDNMLRDKPFLIFANKRDAPAAANDDDLASLLSVMDKEAVKIVPCIAKPSRNSDTVDERLDCGLQWLLQFITRDYQRLNARVMKDTASKQKQDIARKEAQRSRVAAWKEECERCQMLQHDSLYQKSTNSSAQNAANSDFSEVILCYTCSVAPATTKSAASKWMPICTACTIKLNADRISVNG